MSVRTDHGCCPHCRKSLVVRPPCCPRCAKPFSAEEPLCAGCLRWLEQAFMADGFQLQTQGWYAGFSPKQRSDLEFWLLFHAA